MKPRPRAQTGGLDGVSVMRRIEQLAIELAQDEQSLRAVLRREIEDGRVSRALALLEDWEHHAAGDVLKRHGQNGETRHRN